MLLAFIPLTAPFGSLDTSDNETRNVIMHHTGEDRMASTFAMIDPWVNPNFALTQVAPSSPSSSPTWRSAACE
jgi:hypothetical protein